MNNLTNFMKINAIDNDFSLTDDQWNEINKSIVFCCCENPDSIKGYKSIIYEKLIRAKYNKVRIL